MKSILLKGASFLWDTKHKKLVVVILVLLLSLWKKTPLVFFVCVEKAKRYIYIYISVATI